MGSIRNNVTLSLGLVSFQVSVHSAMQDADTPSQFCKGDHDGIEPHAMTKTTQPLFCPECNSRRRSAWVRAMDLGGGVWAEIPADVEEELAAIGQASKNTINLGVRPAVEVAELSITAGKVYYLAATAATAKIYNLFLHAVRKRSDAALIGEFAIKGSPALYHLTVLNDALALRELVRPERVLPAPVNATDDAAWEYEGVLDDAISSIMKPFDAAEFADKRQQRLAEFVASAQGTPVTTPERKDSTPENVVDFGLALAQMVADQQAAKEAEAKPKRTRRRAAAVKADAVPAQSAPKKATPRKRTTVKAG